MGKGAAVRVRRTKLVQSGKNEGRSQDVCAAASTSSRLVKGDAIVRTDSKLYDANRRSGDRGGGGSGKDTVVGVLFFGKNKRGFDRKLLLVLLLANVTHLSFNFPPTIHGSTILPCEDSRHGRRRRRRRNGIAARHLRSEPADAVHHVHAFAREESGTGRESSHFYPNTV